MEEIGTGLWSYHTYHTTEMFPVGKTLRTMGRFLNGDIVRWETWDDMRRMIAAKGWDKTPSRKLDEYAAQYSGMGASAPQWFRAWRRFARWMQDMKTQDRRDDRVRISFGYANYGMDCFEERIQSGHAFLLRMEGVLHIAVVLREGAPYWHAILHGAAVRRHYDRYALLVGGRHAVIPVDAAAIDEMLDSGVLCLFRIAPDALLDAVLSEANAKETLAGLVRTFKFYLAGYGTDGQHFELDWSVVFNPGKKRIESTIKTKPRILEVMLPRGKPWMTRPVPVMDIASVDEIARKVVLEDGFAQLPPNAPEELVRAMTAALFHVTFPDRRPDAPGGILNGYQVPERILHKAVKPVRGDNTREIVSRRKEEAASRIEARRRLVSDTLSERTAKALAARNGLSECEATRIVKRLGGLQMLEEAAWRLGMMEGNPLIQFKGGENGGSLKLPGVSLAVAFEHLAGLSGERWDGGAGFVQTARILPLPETCGRWRCSFEVTVPAHRIGGVNGPLGDCPQRLMRILRDNGKYYILAVPRYGGGYRLGRDLMSGDSKKAVPVPGYRCVSGGGRTRDCMHIEHEDFDFNKVYSMARQGRMALYSVDFGEWQWLADIVYSDSNVSPCRIIAGCKMDDSSVRVTFTVNPQAARGNVGLKPRSWTAYRAAYPDDSHHVIRWPQDGSDKRSALDVVREMTEKDGVIVTDKAHASAVLECARYVVLPERGKGGDGGVYNGYMPIDRIFIEDGKTGKVKPNDAKKGKKKDIPSSGRQSRELRSVLQRECHPNFRFFRSQVPACNPY